MNSLIRSLLFSAALLFATQFAAAQTQNLTIFFTGHIIGNYGPCG